MPQAKLKIGLEFLTDVLKFPSGTRILGSIADAEYVTVVVEHIDLRKPEEGETLPDLKVFYSKGEDYEQYKFDRWEQ